MHLDGCHLYKLDGTKLTIGGLVCHSLLVVVRDLMQRGAHPFDHLVDLVCSASKGRLVSDGGCRKPCSCRLMPITNLIGFQPQLQPFALLQHDIFKIEIDDLLVGSERVVKEDCFFDDVTVRKTLHDDP